MLAPKGVADLPRGHPKANWGRSTPSAAEARAVTGEAVGVTKRGQAIAIGAVAVKGENMRRNGLVLVKILHFEVDNLSPEFLRWVRIPFRQLTQTPTIARPLEKNISSHKASTLRVEGLEGSIIS